MNLFIFSKRFQEALSTLLSHLYGSSNPRHSFSFCQSLFLGGVRAPYQPQHQTLEEAHLIGFICDFFFTFLLLLIASVLLTSFFQHLPLSFGRLQSLTSLITAASFLTKKNLLSINNGIQVQ